MKEFTHARPTDPSLPIPADDLGRTLTVTNPDDARAQHVAVAGDTYTILVAGAVTQGRFCLIDMLVPDGGGLPPHRHDFEEAFSLLEGELESTFRGETRTVKAPTTVNIPANAPHQFANKSGSTVHMLRLCAPAGQEEFFLMVGLPLENRNVHQPKISREQQAEKAKLAAELAPQYHAEMFNSAWTGWPPTPPDTALTRPR